MVKERTKFCKRLTDEMMAQRKTGWWEQEERKCQQKFSDEMGLQPASMTMCFSAHTEDAGNDSDSEIKFG